MTKKVHSSVKRERENNSFLADDDTRRFCGGIDQDQTAQNKQSDL